VNLLPGTYRIDVEKPGFKRVARPDVVVEVGQSVRIDLTLQVGEVTQTVEVTGETPQLQADTSSLGQVVEERKANELPLNGRNVFNLISLAPSVVPQGSATGTPVGVNPFGWGNYQVNGSFGNESAEYLDGQPLNIGYINLPVVIPTQDSIQEFKVQTSNLGADWGKFSGGVINLSTKSGSNTLHGEAYEYLRNKVLDANDFFLNKAGQKRPPFTQNQFGANAGGPLWVPRQNILVLQLGRVPLEDRDSVYDHRANTGRGSWQFFSAEYACQGSLRWHGNDRSGLPRLHRTSNAIRRQRDSNEPS
jgi:hypothetical protein